MTLNLSDSREPTFSDKVIAWQQQHGRHQLPWQIEPTPYTTWLSEVMLQQTQVATVIPYYQRFLQQFPNLISLANASIDEVFQFWQGLGYYARARHLHRASQIIRDEYAGQFPQFFEQVIALPGIGRSTAGAILTFAFGQSWPILDGNVKRVLGRCFQVPGWPAHSKTMQQLWHYADTLTPRQQTDSYNQGMMDLGATICLKSAPKCDACPITDCCASYQNQTQANYPEKKPSRVKPQKQTLMLLHRYQDRVLLQRRPPVGIWGGLWSLPEVESSDMIQAWQKLNLMESQPPEAINENTLTHQFTHFRLQISLATFRLTKLPNRIADEDNIAFVEARQLSKYGLPAPVRKLLITELACS